MKTNTASLRNSSASWADSQDPEFFQRLRRAHATFDCGSHQVFLLHFFQGTLQHFALGGSRDDNHAIDISKNDVARRDADSFDLDWYPEVDHLPAPQLVWRVAAQTKGWEI